MKAKLLRDAGEIIEGTEVEIASRAGANDSRSDKDVGGRSTTVAPVYEVTDDEGHAEKVDTRDLTRCPSPDRSSVPFLRAARGFALQR
jgi:hypothetical protein